MLKYAGAVREILEEVIMYEEFEDDTDLISEEILDSLTIVYLVVQLEERFHITIDEKLVVPENFNSIRTISAFLDQIEKNSL